MLADLLFILMYPVEDDTKEKYVGTRITSASNAIIRALSFRFSITNSPLNNISTAYFNSSEVDAKQSIF
jgi:hypothetical protein